MLDRPIFVVGHARGGSTVLGAILNWHSHVGPRHDPIPRCGSVGELMGLTLRTDDHFRYSERLEQKDVWFDHFPGREVFTHMGRELVAESPPPDPGRRLDLLARLTEGFRERRFLSKAPTNSFRVRAIRALFPDARIVAIYRRGEPVVASWGRRSYGFGRPVNWGPTRIDRLGYGPGIRIFARKWRETLDYLEANRRELGILAVTYKQLATDTQATLRRIVDHLELPFEDYLRDVRLDYRPREWARAIPAPYRPILRASVWGGNRVLRRLERDARKNRNLIGS
jgi:hypothetical protein